MFYKKCILTQTLSLAQFSLTSAKQLPKTLIFQFISLFFQGSDQSRIKYHTFIMISTVTVIFDQISQDSSNITELDSPAIIFCLFLFLSNSSACFAFQFALKSPPPPFYLYYFPFWLTVYVNYYLYYRPQLAKDRALATAETDILNLGTVGSWPTVMLTLQH